MMSFLKNKKNKGIATVEILLASTIVSVALIALTLATQKAVELSSQSVQKVQAAFLLEEAVEAIKQARDDSWSTIDGLTDGTNYYISWGGTEWSLTSTPQATIGGFTRTIVFQDGERDGSDDLVSEGTPDSDTKLVTVTVSWNSENGPASEDLQFYLANIFE